MWVKRALPGATMQLSRVQSARARGEKPAGGKDMHRAAPARTRMGGPGGGKGAAQPFGIVRARFFPPLE